MKYIKLMLLTELLCLCLGTLWWALNVYGMNVDMSLFTVTMFTHSAVWWMISSLFLVIGLMGEVVTK